MQSHPKTLLTLLFVTFLTQCGRRAPDTDWQDGNYRLYVMEGGLHVTKLGFDHHPGVLELVPAEVVAAGSDKMWIVAQRIDPATGASNFYIIRKESGNDCLITPEGPLTAAEFDQEVTKRSLPRFSWHNRW